MDVSFANDVQPIFTQYCATAGCHSGANPPDGLNLEAGMSYGMIVSVASVQLASMNRIEPSDAANSYLVHKMDGTQASVGGAGTGMPPPQAGGILSQMLRDIVRVWAEEGALDN